MIPTIPKRNWRSLSPEERTRIINSGSYNRNKIITAKDGNTALSIACWLHFCLNSRDAVMFTRETDRGILSYYCDPLAWINKGVMYLVDNDLDKLDYLIGLILPDLTDLGRRRLMDDLNKIELMINRSGLKTREVDESRAENDMAATIYDHVRGGLEVCHHPYGIM